MGQEELHTNIERQDNTHTGTKCMNTSAHTIINKREARAHTRRPTHTRTQIAWVYPYTHAGSKLGTDTRIFMHTDPQTHTGALSHHLKTHTLVFDLECFKKALYYYIILLSGLEQNLKNWKSIKYQMIHLLVFNVLILHWKFANLAFLLQRFQLFVLFWFFFCLSQCFYTGTVLEFLCMMFMIYPAVEEMFLPLHLWRSRFTRKTLVPSCVY